MPTRDLRVAFFGPLESVREGLDAIGWQARRRDRRRDAGLGAPRGKKAFDVEMAEPAGIGVIGDVHACDDRLAGLLAFFESRDLDRIICVGDIVTGPGSPDRCVELLADADVLTVRGNHDRWLLEGMPPVGPQGHRLEDFQRACA